VSIELSHRQAINYLRDAAIRAHLDGQGAKARQLAAIALRKGANRRSLPILALEDLAWAFFLVIYWMLEELDFTIVLDGAWESFNKKQQQKKADRVSIENDDNDFWYTIIKFLMDALRPNVNEWMANIKALEEIPRSFFVIRKDKYTNEIFCMILPLVIDFVHYLYPNEKNSLTNNLIWKYLCELWTSHAADENNDDLRRSLETNRIRIEKQHACLVEPGKFSYHAENALEKLWDAFYKIDIEEMKKVLPELTKMVREDDGKFYPVQSLINMTSTIVGSDSDQVPGVYRIQRLYMENPQWLFSRLRLMRFSEVLNDAHFDIRQGKAIGALSSQIWRLVLVSETIALQNWDLNNYRNSIEMQSELWLFWGLYAVDYKTGPLSDNDADNIITGIYQAVKGMILRDEKSRKYSDVKRAFLNLELNKNSKAKIDGLTELIIKSVRPIEKQSAINLFSIMGDTITSDRWKDVLRISIESFSGERLNNDLTMLNWWKDVFKWIALDKSHWDIINPLLTNIFYKPIFWNISGAMLKEALIKAPKDMADKWANIIAESRSNKDLYPSGSAIVYNAALERFDLREYALHILDFLEKDPKLADQMAYDRALLLAANQDKYTISDKPEGQILKNALIEKFIQYAQSVANRTAKPPIIIGGLPFQLDQFRRISWKKLKLNVWHRIDHCTKAAIKNTYCSEGDFISLILIWSIIASQQRKITFNEAGRWLINLSRNFQSKKEQIPKTSSPLSRTSFIVNVKDSTRFAKTVALSRFLHIVSSPICNDMLSWIQDEIPETEEANLPVLWEMLFALYITGTRVQTVWALNGLKAIYARAVTDYQLLTNIMEKTFNVLITPHAKNKNVRLVDVMKNKKDLKSVLDIFEKVIQKLVSAPYPDGRRAAAEVLNLFIEVGWINEQRAAWIECLKNDPRMRVSSVFNKEL
jgi:hypothetical protein